ncbi:MAG: hypothetical protein K8F90_05270 [Hyphomicrobiales bacterium]|nr:hypothetical protein [Hyphomicrobiales bacterium]
MSEQNPANGKTCIFCGEPPDNKTKEHVIPKWLIEITGDPKRIWKLGVRYGEDDREKRERKFAADQFQFPACKACNGAYSELENRAKTYMTKLLAGEPLTASEWDDFLDWFDKVRIGLWLGMRLFSKELHLMPPKFHISQRIGRKDRCVLVYRVNPEHKGFIMHGGGDPLFMFWPSCLALTVNHLIFVNISIEYLISARVGFPFPRKLEDVEGRTLLSNFDAFYRTKTPLIRFSFYPAPISVYQAILVKPEDIVGSGNDHYASLRDNQFIRDRLIPGSDFRSLVHVSDGVTTIACKPEKLIKERDLPQADYRHGVDYLTRFLEYREHMLREYLESGRGQQAATMIKTVIRFNRRAIDQMVDEWKEDMR